MGKTESLRAFARFVWRNFPIVHFASDEPGLILSPSEFVVPGEGDFRMMFSLGGVKVAVESLGDPNTDLEDRLRDLIQAHQCRVVLTATHTRGNTVTGLDRVAAEFGYQGIWTSTYQAPEELQDQVNALKGRHLFELLRGLGWI